MPEDAFSKWFIPKTERIGYRQTYVNSDNDVAWISFNSEFGVVYVKQPIDLNAIRGLFESHANPLLFVVDSTLVNDTTINQAWLRAIHALYYGRIYAWDGKGLLAIHHDKQTGILSQSGYIEMDGVKFDHVDCWYPGFPGQYYVARFDEGVFWKGQTKQRRQKPPPRTNPNEEFWKGYYNNQATEDIFHDFAAAFERNKQAYGAAPHQSPPARPYYAPTGDKWFMMLIETGTLEGAKKKFRELAHEYHPDKAGDSPEVIATMQLINAAYAKVKRILA